MTQIVASSSLVAIVCHSAVVRRTLKTIVTVVVVVVAVVAVAVVVDNYCCQWHINKSNERRGASPDAKTIWKQQSQILLTS